MTTLIAVVLLTILIHVARRLLLRVLGWALFVLAIYGIWHIAPDLGLARTWINTFAGAAAIGFGVGVLFALRPIINWLVNADRKRAHERVDQDHDKRLA